MPKVYGDIETCSQRYLQECGAYIYASDPSTDINCLCYAVGDGDIQVWMRGDPVPAPFVNPANYGPFVWDNWHFDREIYARILVPRYGFTPIPIEKQDCAQRLALANGYPPELDLRCEALGVPYRKSKEARDAMRRLAQLPTEESTKKRRKKKKPEDPAARERDFALLVERCKSDVAATRACYNNPLLRPLLPEERRQLLLDAKINTGGVYANIPFMTAARAFAINERNAINVRLNELTAGIVTSVFQVEKIMEAVNARGHTMPSLNKRWVAATLAQNPEDFVRELLTLRQQGAYSSINKIKKMLTFTDPVDHRVRGVLRYHGTHTGRWSSIGAQLHNLPRNDDELPISLIDAVLAGNRTELARFGEPLNVLSKLLRAVLCAAPEHRLISVDFAAIESRVLAWFAGETWKLEAFHKYDESGDERLHPYRQIAAQMLHKDVLAITKRERHTGKGTELGCGFGGSIDSCQKQFPNLGEAELLVNVRQWRDAHPQTRKFWKRLARAARLAIRTRQAIRVNSAPTPSIVAAFDGHTLTLELPSGRVISYPGARLVPNRKIEDGDPDIEYLDNSKGGWRYTRAWYGVLVENVVSGTARDLLAAALLRADARGWSIVHHCHDEMVIEAPDGALSEQEVLACMLELPTWAKGLPLGGKVHSGSIYFEGPETAEPPAEIVDTVVERAVDAFVAGAKPLPDTKEIERGAEEDFLASLGTTTAPLTDLVTLPMDSSQRVSCPFHEDPNPSCKIYADHWHCFGCGRHGDRMDWLMQAEGMTRAEALDALHDWSGPATLKLQRSAEEKLDFALEIWNAALPLAGSIGERYLAETRGIDISKLPASINDALRFHPNCIFGAGTFCPCVIALMRDPSNDTPVGVHRIGLEQANGKIIKRGRMALGRMGVVQLWPLNGSNQLVIGEGIETALAAATRIPYRSAPLTPAWSAVSSDWMGRLPALPGVKQLILLIDNDENYEGQQAAERCQRIWKSAGRTTVPLMPKQKGWDFNDVVLGRKA